MIFKTKQRCALIATVGSLFPLLFGLSGTAVAQDDGGVAISSGNSSLTAPALGDPGTPEGLILPGNDYSPDFPDDSPTTGTLWTAEGEGLGNFFFPGGYGFLPELVNTGAGWSGKPPASFNFTLQGGYNDNIYSTNGDFGQPKKGSFTTQATLGGNFLLANRRHFLSLALDAGGTYYWNKDSAPLAPTGRISLVYGYKLTPRMQFSARVNGGYFNQPNLGQVNGDYRPNAGDYFTLFNHFDLAYQWTPRIATVTTLEVNTTLYKESTSQDSNYVRLLLGEAFRFKLSPNHTGVMEFRFAQNFYKGPDRDTTSYYLLTGLDSRLTPRLNTTLRVGGELQQYDSDSYSDRLRPFVEASLGYQYGYGSTIRWTNRLGFENSNVANQEDYTYRTGLWVDHVLTSRIALQAGATYAYSALSNVTSSASDDGDGDRQVFTGTVGARYMVNRHITVFANYSYSRVLDQYRWGNYTVNQVWLGTSYYF